VEETSTSTEIPRPQKEVFDFVSEFPNDPTWQRGKVSCTWTSLNGLEVGATYEQHARFLGKDIHQTFRVLELVPGHMVRYESKDGSFPITVIRTVDDLGDGDRGSPKPCRAKRADSSRSLRPSCSHSLDDR
jgi:hypothetical protein